MEQERERRSEEGRERGRENEREDEKEEGGRKRVGGRRRRRRREERTKRNTLFLPIILSISGSRPLMVMLLISPTFSDIHFSFLTFSAAIQASLFFLSSLDHLSSTSLTFSLEFDSACFS